MAKVVLQDVIKQYTANLSPTIKKVNINIEDKEFLVLLGPSGCGKSTLLRMIAGLETVTSGEIIIRDRTVTDIPAKDRNIAMVFQNYALFPHLDVYNNIAFGLKVRKTPKEEIKKQVEAAAEILGLDELLAKRPKQLSGGQCQRVALGRAIVRNPDVFLFDEPLSNLDTKLRGQMRIEINRLHKKLSATMIYVTHDQTEAMTMADKIVVLNEGIVQQWDTPLNIYNNPQNIFVASFLGSPPMNFFSGKLEKQEEKPVLTGDNYQIELKESFISYIGKEITVGVRPEDVHLKSLMPENMDYSSFFSTEIDVIEALGAEICIHCKSGNTPVIARIPPRVSLSPQQRLEITFDKEKLYVFDKNGKRIC